MANVKRRLPLTRKVREGLRHMAGVADAAACADFLGVDENRDEETKADWAAIQAAVRWITRLPE